MSAPDSLLDALHLLYAREWNCGLQSFWDGGFQVWVGDDMNGRDAEENFHPDPRFGRPLEEAANWLLATASAIEARRAETAQTGSVADESAGPQDDAQPSGSPTLILPKKERTK